MKTDEKDVREKDLYIFGHQNPDTDSICSTLAYANLKQKLGFKKVHPCRLGSLNKETSFVLDKLGIDYPELIDSIKPKISDLDYYDSESINTREDIRTAKIKMRDGGVNRRILPVVSDTGKLVGLVSNSNIMHCVERFYQEEELNSEIYIRNLIKNLEPTEIIGEYGSDRVKGNVYVDSLAINKKIQKGDIVVSTNENLTKAILEIYNEFVLIIPSTTNAAFLKNYDTSKLMVIKTPLGLLNTLYMVSQSISVYSIMQKGEMEFFEIDEFIDDVKPIIVESKFTHFPIIDKDNMVHGVLSRRHLLKYQKKNVVLIDHNEIAQTIKGIKEANVIEIVDHHKIDTITTDFPPMLRMEPVGCTSTIVYKLYKENNVDIGKTEAILMLSAILSDTLILHSPTCTEQDIKAATELARIADVKVEEYGKEMIEASFDISDDEWKSVIRSDIKRFKVGSYDIEISNVNIANYVDLLDKKEFIKEQIDLIMQEDKCDTFILMLTDIVNQGSLMICMGKDEKLFNSAFGIPYGEDNIFLRDVLSRKKQVLPKVLESVEKIIK